tara:strand:- start:178 stop:282 length:105 start_codon:yes stop_codon:yes gene_type:complete
VGVNAKQTHMVGNNFGITTIAVYKAFKPLKEVKK